MDKRHLLTGVIIIVLYSLALNLPFLWEREFQGEAARRAVAALEMMERGDYLIPYIEGRPYLLKPPGYNWVLIGFFKAFGSHSEFVARLSSVTAATLCALFLALLFRAIAQPPGLLWVLPGLVFLSLPEVLDKACRAEIDMTYTLLVTVSVFSWFYLHEIRERPFPAWMVGLGFSALATLTKTFQALFFFYTPILPYLFFRKRLKAVLSPFHFLGLTVFGLIFALWFLPASERMGIQTIFQAWFGEYLSKKNSLEPSGFWGHFLKFPLEYLQGHLPWILFLSGWTHSRFRENLEARVKNLALYSLCFLAFSFPIYWFLPGTRLRYLLPTAGGLTFLATVPLYQVLKEQKIPARIEMPLKFLLGATALAVPVFVALSWRHLYLSENPLALFFLAALVLEVGLWFRLRGARAKVWGLFLFLFLAKISFAATYFPYQARHRSHYLTAARKIKALLPKNVVLCDYGVNTPHITYYLKYKMAWVQTVRLVSHPEEWKDCDYLITPKDLTHPDLQFLARIRARRTLLQVYRLKDSRNEKEEAR